MIKKFFSLIELISILLISLQDSSLNTRMSGNFIEKVEYYTNNENISNPPYWLLVLIIISICMMFYVYKKNSQ